MPSAGRAVARPPTAPVSSQRAEGRERRVMTEDAGEIHFQPTDGVSYNPNDALYWNQEALHKELLRSFELCHCVPDVLQVLPVLPDPVRRDRRERRRRPQDPAFGRAPGGRRVLPVQAVLHPVPLHRGGGPRVRPRLPAPHAAGQGDPATRERHPAARPDARRPGPAGPDRYRDRGPRQLGQRPPAQPGGDGGGGRHPPRQEAAPLRQPELRELVPAPDGRRRADRQRPPPGGALQHLLCQLQPARRSARRPSGC